MRCEYCDCEVTTYPDDGICTQCGGRLPPKRTDPAPTQAPAPMVQTVYVSVPQPQSAYMPGGLCCPKCGNIHILRVKRGFSWGWGIFGFFILPVVGILLGFCGRRKPRLKCSSCGHKWKL